MSELEIATTPFGVYVHIPFCSKRCDYCGFATWDDRAHLIEAYLDALEVDINRAIAEGMPVATTVFVGGGTPTSVDPGRLADLIAQIPVVDGAEITVESNPDDVTVELVSRLISGGVNRMSIGVQSMVPEVLDSLGRGHDPDSVRQAVDAVGEAGITTFNLDLIYGAAGETLDDWRHTLDRALALDPPHISAYALTIEAGTPLARQPERHPDDDDQADKYLVTDARLSEHGLDNYEISNWARPGHECRHNLLYWRQQDYRGFGSAAHSHRSGRRWWNVRSPQRYIDRVIAGGSTEAGAETLDEASRRFEGLELLLRMRDGVPLDALDGDELIGLVIRRGDRWVLTAEGRLVQNEIATRLRV